MAFTIDLKEKVVLVTGGSSGIGLGGAREFARAGADVGVVHVRRKMMKV